MRKIAIVVVALGVGFALASSAFAANSVRISQVYGGGGNSGATYTYDYVELFNFSGSPVNIGGWSLQYGSATSTTNLGTCTNCLTVFPPGATIPACGYYLVQLAAGSTPVADLPVTPDLVIPSASANNLSATTGKIGLKADANPAGTPCSPQSAFVDLVGWGTANCFETAVAGAPSNSSMLVRNGAGTADTDNNFNDFTVVAGAVPRNSQSPKNIDCLATPATSKTWGRLKTIYR